MANVMPRGRSPTSIVRVDFKRLDIDDANRVVLLVRDPDFICCDAVETHDMHHGYAAKNSHLRIPECYGSSIPLCRCQACRVRCADAGNRRDRRKRDNSARGWAEWDGLPQLSVPVARYVILLPLEPCRVRKPVGGACNSLTVPANSDRIHPRDRLADAPHRSPTGIVRMARMARPCMACETGSAIGQPHVAPPMLCHDRSGHDALRSCNRDAAARNYIAHIGQNRRRSSAITSRSCSSQVLGEQRHLLGGITAHVGVEHPGFLADDLHAELDGRFL